MSALRCTTCGISWPMKTGYRKCPSCAEETDPIGNVKPDMSDIEARAMKRDFEFTRFYAEWDESHDPARLKTLDEQEEAMVARSVEAAHAQQRAKVFESYKKLS